VQRLLREYEEVVHSCTSAESTIGDALLVDLILDFGDNNDPAAESGAEVGLEQEPK
jgi:hypothetical protein